MLNFEDVKFRKSIRTYYVEGFPYRLRKGATQNLSWTIKADDADVLIDFDNSGLQGVNFSTRQEALHALSCFLDEKPLTLKNLKTNRPTWWDKDNPYFCFFKGKNNWRVNEFQMHPDPEARRLISLVMRKVHNQGFDSFKEAYNETKRLFELSQNFCREFDFKASDLIKIDTLL